MNLLLVNSVGKLEMEFYGIMHMKNSVFVDVAVLQYRHNKLSIVYCVTPFISTWRRENTVAALSEIILRKL